MKGGLLLDVVVAQGTSILQLLSGKDETLLIWWDSFFILNLGLHVLDGVTGLHFQGDSLTSQGFHKDLHTTSKTQHKMKGRLFLDVVVAEGSTILKLFTSKDQTLLVWWDSFFVLNLGLHILDSVARFDFQGDGLPSQGLHKDLHTTTES